jgi:hypothetical protein
MKWFKDLANKASLMRESVSPLKLNEASTEEKRDDAYNVLYAMDSQSPMVGAFLEFDADVREDGIFGWLDKANVNKDNYNQLLEHLYNIAQYSKTYGKDLMQLVQEVKQSLDSLVMDYSGPDPIQDPIADLGEFTEEDFEIGRLKNPESGDEDTEYNLDGISYLEYTKQIEEKLDSLDKRYFSIADGLVGELANSLITGTKYSYNVKPDVSLVDKAVLEDEIKQVRATGLTNMFDVNQVVRIGRMMNLPELDKLGKSDEKAVLYSEIVHGFKESTDKMAFDVSHLTGFKRSDLIREMALTGIDFGKDFVVESKLNSSWIKKDKLNESRIGLLNGSMAVEVLQGGVAVLSESELVRFTKTTLNELKANVHATR